MDLGGWPQHREIAGLLADMAHIQLRRLAVIEFYYQPLADGWRLWFYRMTYDGARMWALHIGPIVICNDPFRGPRDAD